jgi:hypothetical protein
MSNEWQPIETAPKDGTHIIGYDPSDSIYAGVKGIHWIPEEKRMFDGHEITRKGYWAKSVHDCCVEKPTHWMPLPKPPTETK